MKRLLFSVLCILLSITAFGQDSLSNESAIQNDSITVAKSSKLGTRSLGNVTKTSGDSAYIKNDYATAIQIYESLLKKGEAADIYYNLGNCYYKAGDIAKAILNYERALLLQPGSSDIRANLEIARGKTIDKVEPVPELFFVTWIKAVINSMGIDSWAILGIILFISFIVSLYFFFFSKQMFLKKSGFIGGMLFFFLTILANVFALYQKDTLENRNAAIVMSPSVTVRSTPNETGTSLFILHEGSKTTIKDNSMKEWKEIHLEDGKVGWVKSVDIEII
nr:tetratricopeptide repeat protein [uncultured Bacteroides sp.]